jgi:hypothetical protein
MILRRITQHVKDQNWFAVGIDFVIVVAGILIAFQITNWSEERQGLNELASAESALQIDLSNNYFFAKERVAFSDCRIEEQRNLGERLLAFDSSWTGMTRNDQDSSQRAFKPVLRSPSRIWGSRVWNTELARGTFNLMDNDRKNQFDVMFKQTLDLETLEDELQTLQARLKVLGQNIDLSKSERLRYFDIVSELDEKSFLMERIAAQVAEQIEAIGIVVDENDKPALRETLAQQYQSRQEIYGPCVKPITLYFLEDQSIEVNP